MHDRISTAAVRPLATTLIHFPVKQTPGQLTGEEASFFPESTPLIHCPVKRTPGQLTGEANFLCSSSERQAEKVEHRREPSLQKEPPAEGRRELQVEREVEHRHPRVDVQVSRLASCPASP